jgi:hypothetical protein
MGLEQGALYGLMGALGGGASAVKEQADEARKRDAEIADQNAKTEREMAIAERRARLEGGMRKDLLEREYELKKGLLEADRNSPEKKQESKLNDIKIEEAKVESIAKKYAGTPVSEIKNKLDQVNADITQLSTAAPRRGDRAGEFHKTLAGKALMERKKELEIALSAQVSATSPVVTTAQDELTGADKTTTRQKKIGGAGAQAGGVVNAADYFK